MKSLIVIATLLFAGLFSFKAVAHEHHLHADEHLVFANNVHAHIFWETKPVENVEAILRIEFMNGVDHTPLAIQATPSVEVVMPSMPHPGVPTVVDDISSGGGTAPGIFRVSEMFFTMQGAWEVQLTLTDAAGATETKAFAVQIGEAGAGGHDGHSGHHKP